MTRFGLILVLVVAALAAACNDRTRSISPRGTTPSSSLQPDLGIETDVAFDQPVRGLCVPGSRRCIAANSPQFERCRDDGTSFGAGTCTDGEVCREASCVAFSCVPQRPLCIGATTAAICDESGTAVADAHPCEGAEVCVGGTCVDPCQIARDTRSYITCEYKAQELPNLYQQLPDSDQSPFAIVVANPSRQVSSHVTVRDLGEIAQLREPFRLAPGPSYGVGRATDLGSEVLLASGSSRPIESADAVEIPPGAAGVFMVTGSGAYDIQSTRPVVAYQFSPYCCNFTATNDASLLLPTSSWGKRYRVLGYPTWRVSSAAEWVHAYITVVSDVPTTVRVTSPATLTTGSMQGKELEVTLEPGLPVQFSTAYEGGRADSRELDLSGAVVEADDPVGVFTGHPCVFVPDGKWACDHLEEALLPAEILGARYVLTPVRRRSNERGDPDAREATYWRIVADETSTLTFAPTLSELDVLASSTKATPACADGMTLEAGEVCEFGTTQPTTLSSTGALIVGGVISGHESTGVRFYGSQAGDPSLFVLPPVEQFRSSYAFVSPPTFLRTYVTVAAAPSSPVTLDGRAVPDAQRLERRVVSLGGVEWEVFTIAIESGVHTMESTTRFGIVAYAYDDYVSYAFTGGLDLVPKGAR